MTAPAARPTTAGGNSWSRWGGNRQTGPCWDLDTNGHSVGNLNQQAGTLMHELGHTLGLRHGGDVEDNDKPNYLSVMSYAFQQCRVPTSPGLLPGECDYSRVVAGNLPIDLNETDLDECVAIGGGLGFGKVDWNGNNVFQGASQCGPIFSNTIADTNTDGICVRPGSNGTLETSPAGDDTVKRGNITDGKDRFCDTAVLAGSDDVQAGAVGVTPSQPRFCGASTTGGSSLRTSSSFRLATARLPVSTSTKPIRTPSGSPVNS
jgi:hypothetical protein